MYYILLIPKKKNIQYEKKRNMEGVVHRIHLLWSGQRLYLMEWI
jgi:hypothetical protein